MGWIDEVKDMKEKELQLILEEGEGYKIEFKETLSNLDKEIVAFANATGGRIFLGITDDRKVNGKPLSTPWRTGIILKRAPM